MERFLLSSSLLRFLKLLRYCLEQPRNYGRKKLIPYSHTKCLSFYMLNVLVFNIFEKWPCQWVHWNEMDECGYDKSCTVYKSTLCEKCCKSLIFCSNKQRQYATKTGDCGLKRRPRLVWPLHSQTTNTALITINDRKRSLWLSTFDKRPNKWDNLFLKTHKFQNHGTHSFVYLTQYVLTLRSFV